jgi:hypothetical protein
MELIQLFVFLLGDLTGLSKAIVAGMKFSARAKSNIQMIQVLFESATAITFLPR